MNYTSIYKLYHGKVPKDKFGRLYDIHHIDGDKTNNSILNLIALSIQDHFEVHDIQGDYGACFAISLRMETTPERKAELCSKAQRKLLEEGKHRFLDKEWQKEKYHKQDKKVRSNISRKSCEQMVQKGIHPFLGGNIQREAHKRRKLLGNYLSGKDASMFGKSHSEESKQKMRGSRKPYGPQSEEHKRKRSESLKNKKRKNGKT